MPEVPEFAPDGASSVPLRLIRENDSRDWEEHGSLFVRKWTASCGFKGRAGQVAALPDENGNLAQILVGWPDGSGRDSKRFRLAETLRQVPAGNYRLEGELTADELDEAALAALFAQYSYDRYAPSSGCEARLQLPQGCDRERLLAIGSGEFLTRDLINTPASDLGPDQLEAAVRKQAARHGAAVDSVCGEELEHGFPLIHAVGRAAAAPPRLLDLQWGSTGPLLTLIGKGICFDTGGLNIKPGRSMALMKKDMGGAAVAAGLAEMIMRLGLPLRLRVLIPAAENAIAGDAMRPGDVLTARSGRTVEVTNTDAEGRLVLADAIDFSQESSPDLLITFATLTGAARVALGSEIVPYFTDSESLAECLEKSSRRTRDPLWRMPLWQGYDSMLKSDIADMLNAPAGGLAGAITAALFLRRFVISGRRWAHFDLYCWQPKAEAGRPKGGVGQASRAVLDALPAALSL